MTFSNVSTIKKLRGAARRVRTSAPIRILGAMPGAVRFWTAPGDRVWQFDLTAPIGMGAMLTHAVAILHFAEQSSVSARFKFTNPLYVREHGRDWFSDFFVQREPMPPETRLKRISVRNHWDYQMMSRGPSQTLADAHMLFQTKLGFSEAANAVLAAAKASLPTLNETIGVHYRGTDKTLEARRTGMESVFHAVRTARTVTGYKNLFLATDEEAFAQVLAERFPDMTISSWQHANVNRVDGVPIHFSDGDGHAKGMEAVTLIRLLAETGLLIRTASYLSAWSQILRPDLPSYFVNPWSLYKPMFPDAQLLAAAPFAVTR